MGDDFKTRSDKRRFINELRTVSESLAIWAQARIYEDDWSVEDCKIQLRNAMKLVESVRS